MSTIIAETTQETFSEPDVHAPILDFFLIIPER